MKVEVFMNFKKLLTLLLSAVMCLASAFPVFATSTDSALNTDTEITADNYGITPYGMNGNQSSGIQGVFTVNLTLVLE